MPEHVAGGAVRLLELEELPRALRERLEPRVRRLGYLGAFFRVAAHQPEALAAFVDFTEAGKAALTDDVVELIALTCSTATRNAYERHQHEQLAVRRGLGTAWIAEVERLDPEAADLSPAHRRVQRYVLDALADHGHGAAPALRALAEALGEPAAVAVMLVCGRYAAHALLANSCALAPPVPSVLAGTEARP